VSFKQAGLLTQGFSFGVFPENTSDFVPKNSRIYRLP